MVSECLDCLTGSNHVGVPLETIERLVEYQVSGAPPLSHPWVGGIGLIGDDLFVSIRLRPLTGPTAPRREAKGLLLRSAPGQLRWALEVDRIVGVDELHVDGSRRPEAAFAEIPPAWLVGAVGPDGRELAWL